jgi:hypothetical protein
MSEMGETEHDAAIRVNERCFIVGIRGIIEIENLTEFRETGVSKIITIVQLFCPSSTARSATEKNTTSL